MPWAIGFLHSSCIPTTQPRSRHPGSCPPPAAALASLCCWATHHGAHSVWQPKPQLRGDLPPVTGNCPPMLGSHPPQHAFHCIFIVYPFYLLPQLYMSFSRAHLINGTLCQWGLTKKWQGLDQLFSYKWTEDTEGPGQVPCLRVGKPATRAEAADLQPHQVPRGRAMERGPGACPITAVPFSGHTPLLPPFQALSTGNPPQSWVLTPCEAKEKRGAGVGKHGWQLPPSLS